MKMAESKYQRAMALKNEAFKLLTGVSKQTAEEMLIELKNAYSAKHKRRGRHSKLAVEDMLMLALEYWRQYPTMFELGFEFGLAKSSVHDIIVWVEDTLIKSGLFVLPGKKSVAQ
jgi:Holliday junction resolvasome RuvABC DNA-binding subunit